MRTNLSDPWITKRVLFGKAARAEAVRQHAAVADLLATTLPREVRLVLRQFEQSLSRELATAPTEE